MSMRIDVVDTPEGLAALRPVWDAAYAADPETNVFLSWSWLHGWLEVTPHDWMVLAASPSNGTGHVAFLPLASSVNRWRGFPVTRELSMAGKPFADYSGCISHPEYAEAALIAFGRHIREELFWDRFRVAEVTDSRFDAFFAGFGGAQFSVRRDPPVASYFIRLPSTWDEYTRDFMSAQGRYNLGRGTRQLEKLDSFRTCVAGEEDLDAHMQALLGMWQSRWGERHPADLMRYRHMFRHALASKQLWLRTIWVDDAPVASLVGFVDRVKGAFLYYISGFNPDFARYSPGKVIVGYAIRYAIDQGLGEFDLLLGDESYKHGFFGASARNAQSATVLRNALRSRIGRRLAHLQRRSTS